ncbi:MAG: hypothetical protein IPG00_02795 [Saprospiraceae bacterium]|nr:hypothetical protein [Saprospiraceae bacterium]
MDQNFQTNLLTIKIDFTRCSKTTKKVVNGLPNIPTQRDRAFLHDMVTMMVILIYLGSGRAQSPGNNIHRLRHELSRQKRQW